MIPKFRLMYWHGYCSSVWRYLKQTQKYFLLFLLIPLVAFSCGKPKLSSLINSPDCHVITHAMGESCVPKDPRRVVVWGATELDPVLALGIQPIAGNINVLSYVKEKLPPEKWENIKDIDGPQGPNLEYLLELKPDLILGHKSRIGQIYPQLSRIASTVLDDSDDWKTTFQLFAEALAKNEKAQQVMDNYNERITSFKARIHQQLPFTVSSVEIRSDVVILDTKDSFALSIIQEAGLSLPSALSQYTWENWVLSKERLDQLESDTLFLRMWGGVVSERQAAQSRLEKLKADRLWNELEVVKQGNVYEVGDYFQGGGPITANLILDDLFNFLLTDP